MVAVTGYKVKFTAGDTPEMTLADEFFSSIVVKSQQENSLLRGHVTPHALHVGTMQLVIPMGDPLDGETGFEDTITSGLKTAILDSSGADIRQVTKRYEETKHSIILTRKRVLASTRFRHSPVFERVDAMSRLANPHDHARRQTMSRFNRHIDDKIITAFTATATEYQEALADSNDRTESSVVFPVDQVVDSDFSFGMTATKLEEVLEMFGLKEVDVGAERPVLALSPAQLRNLREANLVQSSDFSSSRPMDTNQLPSIMGFDIVVSNRLPVSNNVRTCFAFMPSAMMLATWEEMFMEVSTLPSQNYATQLFFEHESGALRIRDEGVIKIFCAEVLGEA